MKHIPLNLDPGKMIGEIEEGLYNFNHFFDINDKKFEGFFPLIENSMSKTTDLKPCPFCGRTPKIIVCDREGNIHDEADYEADPWSGLTFAIAHEREKGIECPIATHEDEILGSLLFDTRDELTELWNKRLEL